ncbi:hypothetical protein H1R20_g6726, partial [Candolleomyces eurysporus]
MVCPEPIRWGGMVFFKVEEIAFEVPRSRFIENSEVFEAMFHLPVGNENEEGRDEEHPIVLDGYKAVDFNALIKILYPVHEDVISGSYTLTKEEWVGVLSLSTRWDMKKELTKLSLNPVEKVAIAREYKVGQWFQEGLNEIITERPFRPLSELKSQLGADTVCTLLWIRSETRGSESLVLTLGSLSDLYIRDGVGVVGLVTTLLDTDKPVKMEPHSNRKDFSMETWNMFCGSQHVMQEQRAMINQAFRDEIADYELPDN